MLNKNVTPLFEFYSIRSSDIDDFANFVAPRDLHFKNLGKAKFFSARAEMLRSEDFTMAFTDLRAVLQHTGNQTIGMRTYLIPMDQHFFWRNLEINHDNIGFYNIGSEINTISKVGFKICVLSISEQTLASSANHMGIDWLSLNSNVNGVFYSE